MKNTKEIPSVSKSCRKRKLSVSIERLRLPLDQCSMSKNLVNISDTDHLSTNIFESYKVGTTEYNKNNKIDKNKRKAKIIKDNPSKSKSAIKCDVTTIHKIDKNTKKCNVIGKNIKCINKYKLNMKTISSNKRASSLCKLPDKNPGVIINAGKLLKRAPIKNRNENTVIVVNSKTNTVSFISKESENSIKDNRERLNSSVENLDFINAITKMVTQNMIIRMLSV